MQEYVIITDVTTDFPRKWQTSWESRLSPWNF